MHASMVPAGRRRRPARPLAVLLAIVLLALGGCTSTYPHRHRQTSSALPNIVLVLTDDLSNNLVRYMPHVLAMERHGMAFSNYTVTDSLCCPSRASILTGDYPHDTGVFTNEPPLGGYAEFRQHGDEQATVATALHDAGYRTALMGKYLNGYEPGTAVGLSSPTPPGWDEWDGVGDGYREYDYLMAQNGATRFLAHRPDDYLSTVLERRATDFIQATAAGGDPFFLEVATFAPHAPYVPAPADADAFPGLTAPRTRAFDRLPSDAPGWLAARRPLTREELARIDRAYRLRAQDVLAVDRLIGSIDRALTEAGVSDDTVIVFSSDNGYHMGEYRLNPGKMTAFDTDVNVPLVVTGPAIPAGLTSDAVVQNIDLAPTFEALAGLPPSQRTDGASIVDLLHHGPVTSRLAAALIEHRGPNIDLADPDYPEVGSGNPPSYEAIRTASYTYVEYVTGSTEYYDRRTDPLELHNTVARLSPERRRHLHRKLGELVGCQGSEACTAARATP